MTIKKFIENLKESSGFKKPTDKEIECIRKWLVDYLHPSPSELEALYFEVIKLETVKFPSLILFQQAWMNSWHVIKIFRTIEKFRNQDIPLNYKQIDFIHTWDDIHRAWTNLLIVGWEESQIILHCNKIKRLIVLNKSVPSELLFYEKRNESVAV